MSSEASTSGFRRNYTVQPTPEQLSLAKEHQRIFATMDRNWYPSLRELSRRVFRQDKAFKVAHARLERAIEALEKRGYTSNELSLDDPDIMEYHVARNDWTRQFQLAEWAHSRYHNTRFAKQFANIFNENHINMINIVSNNKLPSEITMMIVGHIMLPPSPSTFDHHKKFFVYEWETGMKVVPIPEDQLLPGMARWRLVDPNDEEA